MKKIEVQNFQNLTIENAKIINIPLNQAKNEEKDVLTIVFIRDPYEYFDYLLFDYLTHKRSLLFTQDIISTMKKLDNEDFLKWFKTLNFIPFYNPQTFQLDICKKSLTAIENLESFDYVVPYEKINIFLENISSDITITAEKEKKLLFSLNSQRENELVREFIGKDMELYGRSLELWELIEKNDFQPLRLLIDRKRSQSKMKEIQKYRGVAGRMTSNSIIGWVFNKEKQESITIEIYKNDNFLCITEANKMRLDLQKQQIHPTGQCGFEVSFDKQTFQKGDKIEIKILPEKTILPLGENIKNFLGE